MHGRRRADQHGQLDGVDEQDPGQAPEEQVDHIVPSRRGRPAGAGTRRAAAGPRRSGRWPATSGHGGRRRAGGARLSGSVVRPYPATPAGPAGAAGAPPNRHRGRRWSPARAGAGRRAAARPGAATPGRRGYSKLSLLTMVCWPGRRDQEGQKLVGGRLVLARGEDAGAGHVDHIPGITGGEVGDLGMHMAGSPFCFWPAGTSSSG